MEKKSTFTGKVGFVMAAAASAVGLGNLWRFPYLAAKYGGGTFLLIYLILAVTFGFTLMVTEVAIGRRTGKSVLNAYGAVSKKFRFLGPLVFLVPAIITPYYCVVGGWVLKYFAGFIAGENEAMTDSSFFSNFIGAPVSPLIYTAIFLGATAVIVALGVEKGIEKFSKILMPILIGLSVILAVYVCTMPGAGAGILYYLKPDFTEFKFETVVAATGQLFYSLSLGMAIMITYGSYMKKDVNIESSARQIEVFDTLVAFLAGMIIVPAVYVFSNGDKSQLSQGAGLMFVTLPKVFATMPLGRLVGILFFLLVIFAALTSSISLLEALVAVALEKTKLTRVQATVIITILCMIVAVPSVLGYNVWSAVKIAGFAFLDFFDFISNSVLMPFVECLTCLMIGWFVGSKYIEDEAEFDSQPFKAKKMYRVMVKYVAPILLVIILISSILNALGIVTI
ncbi:MAG: sodium-dependent transporter [Lachnospiraceae bacterium]|jgi:NSS family neurotransmitter:Na+ symporter|nr:sodium-dependent transporter [Lachnospiraceae bacterium]MCI1727011.1 sodium-dependent transporter [Lachnospiraceae bacterium]